ncbi:hypothetical protein [Streptomyces sp. NPDC058476]|uniref:hypothetical protein n=1 Tax=Streptomyces sp. NPDC058476 TaxID=3346519 RepID=UPI003657C01D
MTSASDLIRPTTRRQFLETAKSLKKATIEACWQDGGFLPVALENPPSTERAAMFASYSAGVDWTDEQHVERALGVFEALLREKKADDDRYPHAAGNWCDGVQQALGQDGYQLTERLQIVRFGGWRPEHATSDAESYQLAVRLLVGARNQMERLPALVASLPEERLRDILLVSLNAFFEGESTGETLNGKGKTDLLLRIGDRNVMVGECKIWGGSVAFGQAIDQLLGNLGAYDTQTVIPLFIREKDPEGMTQRAADAVKDHPAYSSTGSMDAVNRKYEFVLDHGGRGVTLTVVPFALA